MMNFKMKNKTLFLCLPAMLNIPFGGSSAFGANSEKDNKENSIAKKYKENPAIIHAIEAHHGDVEAKTPLAFIVMAADAISAARPGARRENLESYIKRLESLEEIASGFEGVERSFAIQAGREVRIMVKPDAINDDALILLAHSISQKIEETLDYPGQIKVNVIRESRAVDYAK